MVMKLVQYLRDLSDNLSTDGRLNRYITVCINHGEVNETLYLLQSQNSSGFSLGYFMIQ